MCFHKATHASAQRSVFTRRCSYLCSLNKSGCFSLAFERENKTKKKTCRYASCLLHVARGLNIYQSAGNLFCRTTRRIQAGDATATRAKERKNTL